MLKQTEYILSIFAVVGSLAGPISNLLNAVTMTTTVPLNKSSGSDGAVNVDVVVLNVNYVYMYICTYMHIQ